MKRAALTLCFVIPALSACGFTPLHSTSASAPLPPLNLDFVYTDASGATGDKIEFLLRQSLKDRMGSAASSPYTLSLDSEVLRSDLGIRSDDVATRFDLSLNVKYTLSDKATGDELDRGSVRAVSTFGAPNDPYGRTTAQFDAEERVASEASDLLIMKLARYFKTQS